MKKFVTVLLAVCLLTAALAGCASSAKTDDKTIVVGASSTPHAEILAQAKPILEAEGWTLEVKEFQDYVQPNNVVESGEFDANYFQHIPYLNNFNQNNSKHCFCHISQEHNHSCFLSEDTKGIGSSRITTSVFPDINSVHFSIDIRGLEYSEQISDRQTYDAFHISLIPFSHV